MGSISPIRGPQEIASAVDLSMTKSHPLPDFSIRSDRSRASSDRIGRVDVDVDVEMDSAT